MKLKSKRSVVLEAARMVAEHEERFACCALDKVAGAGCVEREEFTQLFKPDNSSWTAWFSPDSEDVIPWSEENFAITGRNFRVIALLLFAEMLRR